MSDDNPYVIPEMDPTLRKQIQECNWQVVNVTTPANYFHVLRRQVIVYEHAFMGSIPFKIFNSLIFLYLDTQRFPETSNCDVSKEPASAQGLQVTSF